MTRKTLFGTAAILAMMAGGANADVTPAQVWTDFKGYIEGFGYSVTGTESTQGGTLTVSDLIYTVSQPEAGATFSIQMDQLVFDDMGDGRVRVVFPPSIPFRIVGQAESGDETDVTVEMLQSDLDMIVSGDPNNLTYDYTATQIAMRLIGMDVDGRNMVGEVANMNFNMNGMSGRSVVSVGNLRQIEQRLRADSLSYDFSVNNPEEDVAGSAKGSMTGLVFSGTNSMPLSIDSEDINLALKNGFALNGTFTHNGSTLEIAGEDDGQPINLNTTSASGRLQVGMDQGGVTYALSNTGQSINMLVPDLPFPILLNSAQSSAFLNIPVSAAERSQDFGLGLSMGDLTLSDGIWNLFDPGQILPRDPATLIMDVTGKARILVDLLQPEAVQETLANGDQPGLLEAVNINNLQLGAVGANLTGSGAFTFDNSAGLPGGMPKPTGVANLSLTGANALIDRLIQMGIIGEEEAMGARMMMSMVAVPGQAEDSLTSKIEINEQGHVLANGMRIQ